MHNPEQKAAPLDPWIIQEEIDRQRREEEKKRKQPVSDLPLESPETEPTKPKKERESTIITWDIGETPPSDGGDQETNDGIVQRWRI